MTLSNFLLFMYALTWMMCGVFQSEQWTGGLMVLSFFPATWFFLKGIFSTTIRNAVVMIFLFVLSCFFPPLFALLGLWGAVCLILRFFTFMCNLIPICTGLMLYVLAATVPKWLVTHLHPDTSHWLGMIGFGAEIVILGMVGACLMAFATGVFQGLGYSNNRSTALMMGFPSYLFLFILLLLIPGPDFDGGDDA